MKGRGPEALEMVGGTILKAGFEILESLYVLGGRETKFLVCVNFEIWECLVSSTEIFLTF